MQPRHQAVMGLFSTNLLLQTLRAIVEEIERVDPNSRTSSASLHHRAEKLEPVRSGTVDNQNERIVSAA